MVLSLESASQIPKGKVFSSFNLKSNLSKINNIYGWSLKYSSHFEQTCFLFIGENGLEFGCH